MPPARPGGMTSTAAHSHGQEDQGPLRFQASQAEASAIQALCCVRR